MADGAGWLARLVGQLLQGSEEMTVRRHQMNLRGRRRELGATIRGMANGLGLTVADVVAIERNGTSDTRVELYLAWLAMMEAWPAAKRERELRAADHEGRRFAPKCLSSLRGGGIELMNTAVTAMHLDRLRL